MHYQRYQPTFWRKAQDSREQQIPFLESLLKSEDVIMLVHESTEKIEGFIIADFVAAPPVYDPGGPTCKVDDFCVAEEHLWENVGLTLLNEVLRLAKERGAAQSVVVCGHLDQPKRAMLAQLGYRSPPSGMCATFSFFAPENQKGIRHEPERHVRPFDSCWSQRAPGHRYPYGNILLSRRWHRVRRDVL